MVKINQKILTISFFAIMVIATISISSFSSVYANGDSHKNNNNDKVKVNCKDVALALVTLKLALGDLDEEGQNTLEDELQEGEIANNVDELNDNFQNVLDKVNDKCEDVNFLGFVEFE
jgi:hypothetical protein